MSVYVHYGHTEFKKELFKPIKNERCFSKPMGGFWASPVNAETGWKQWCTDENFRVCSEDNCFRFTLSNTASVLRITDKNQLAGLPHVETKGFLSFDTHYLDFESLLKAGIDAVEVTISGGGGLYMALYGWDVDSILIMNPDIVEPINHLKSMRG